MLVVNLLSPFYVVLHPDYGMVCLPTDNLETSSQLCLPDDSRECPHLLLHPSSSLNRLHSKAKSGYLKLLEIS